MIHKDTCIQLLVVMMKAVDVEDLFHITKLDKMALAKLRKVKILKFNSLQIVSYYLEIKNMEGMVKINQKLRP